MRLLTLARIATEAEGLRWKATLRRQARRGLWGGIAALFGVLLLAMLHLAAYQALAPRTGPAWAALILAGADLVLLLVFGTLATRDRPSADEQEAERIGRAARAEIASTATAAAMVAPIARVIGGAGLRGDLVSALLMNWFTFRRKGK